MVVGCDVYMDDVKFDPEFCCCEEDTLGAGEAGVTVECGCHFSIC